MITREMLEDANRNIPTVNIKGKNYVMVKDRVKRFRQMIPGGRIETKLLHCDDESCTFVATVYDGEGNILATGHANEVKTSSIINKTSYIENCETGAIGRALGLAGIGIDDSFGSADEVATAINRQEQRISADDARKIKAMLEETQSNVKAFLANFKVGSVDEILAIDVPKAYRMLNAKYEKMRGEE